MRNSDPSSNPSNVPQMEQMYRRALLRVDKQYHEACLVLALERALDGDLSGTAARRALEHREALEAIERQLWLLGDSSGNKSTS
jgi:hypothetical protein